MPIQVDGRMAMQSPPPRPDLRGQVGALFISVSGGCLLQAQAGLFDTSGNLVAGFGLNVNGQLVAPLDTTEGPIDWLFHAPANVASLKWSCQYARSSGGTYIVTTRILDVNGNVLAAGKYSGQVPDGRTFDGPDDDFVFFA